VSVDFSEAMLARAIARIRSDRVTFARADINGAWIFAHEAPFDLVVFSLVLEHIEDLDEIFEKLSSVIDSGGYVYIGELHPYKQYLGTKARYEASGELHELTCFTHSVSDFTKAAEKYGFAIAGIDEYFDDDDRKGIPRVLVLLFRKEEDHV
jgi:predicted TPR repeat methyltransferase